MEPAVHDHGDVDVYNVPVFELFIARDAVTNHMIDRDTARVFITLIADGGGFCPRRDHLLLDDAVDLGGGLAHGHMLCDLVQYRCGQFARCVHACEISRLVDTDTVFCRATFVGVCHRSLHRCVRRCLACGAAKGQRGGNVYPFGRDVGADADGFNTGLCRLGVGGCVFGINVGGNVHMGAIGALHQIQ